MSRVRAALDEIAAAAEGVAAPDLSAACAEIAAARRIALAGCGRERLQLMGLAMRLHHLGLDATVAGEMRTPPLGPGDLLIAAAGPGELATVRAVMARARQAGARILFLTAEPGAPLATLADRVLAVPAQTMARDVGGDAGVLPMGSVFEGALFVLFEAMVLELMDRLGVTAAEMRARHTNLE